MVEERHIKGALAFHTMPNASSSLKQLFKDMVDSMQVKKAVEAESQTRGGIRLHSEHCLNSFYIQEL